MNISRVNKAAGMILSYIDKETFPCDEDSELECCPLMPDEKIAALNAASQTIIAVLGAEMFRVTFSQIINGCKK